MRLLKHLVSATVTLVGTFAEYIADWGVEQDGSITACESEQEARRLQADSGGALVARKTYFTSWSQLPATGAQRQERAAIPKSA